MQVKKINTIYRNVVQIAVGQVTFGGPGFLKLSALSFILLVLLPGCSFFKGDSRAKDGAQTAVVQVSVEYLRLCLLANTSALNSYVLLGEYLRHQGLNLEEYNDQVYKLARRWPVSENPVVQLRVLDADISDDKAVVTFQREGSKSEFPVVKIELIWIGNSWIITRDSIFGKNGTFVNYK